LSFIMCYYQYCKYFNCIMYLWTNHNKTNKQEL